ncbi:meiosis-specific protein ASY2-like [Raphanus sativus]|uniref:Meiosis-specific protein ASY2-like n=1 Tax=Raphanus sativus TaxID=3726 RepID=A0A9W3CGV3_RAPSA|nr:meiosis-specific protein ASY2-like [Raphanus sativus]
MNLDRLRDSSGTGSADQNSHDGDDAIDDDGVDRPIEGIGATKTNPSGELGHSRGGMIEQVLDLAPELARSSSVGSQDWGDVLPTRSTVESVTSLLKACRAFGVTFVIPGSDQRPWTPPLGYHCVYESFFGREAKLWFPIPRLITSYCARRDVAMTQIMIGTIRIAVALMVMAAEIDVSMPVRTFEEVIQTQPKPNGFLGIQMRSGFHILMGHPSPPKQWQRFYFYVKADEAAFEEPPSEECRVLWSDLGLPHAIGARDTFWRDLPKIAVLRQQSWGDFSLDRIERQRERIARVDWMSKEPFVEGKGKRLPLPIMGKIPKAYLNYSEILRAQLSGGNFGSVSSLKDKEAEAQISSSGKIGTDERGTESQGLPIENADVMTIDPSASESADPTLSASPLKRKEKKKKSKSSKEMVIDSGDGRDSVGKNTAAIDQSADREKEPEDLAEEGQTALPISKRKEPADGGSLDHGGKRLKKAYDNSSRSSSEIALPASRLLPWGGLGPPSDRLALAVSERWAFRHDKDGPLVGDPSACAELVRQIRGGTQLMPETPTLAFPDRFAESAQADVEAIFRKNQLIADYELVLRKMASDFASAEATIEAKEMEIEELKQAALVIEAKDVEIEKLKQAALVKSKEIVDERTRFYRERKQAKQTSDDLEEELETAHSKVAELKAEAEDLKKTMEFAKQVHRRDLASQTSRIAAAANECFDKFKRYMVDRDRREEKLILHSEASGTLGSMDVLKDFGTSIPKELIDTLTANEANFRRDMEEVTVEAITEQDFILPRFSGLDVSPGLNQSDKAMDASSSDKVV